MHQARRQLHRLQQNQISNRAPAAVRQPGHSFFVEASGSHEFALGFRFSQLSAARPLRHSAADAVQTGEVFFEVAGGREGEIEGHAVAFIGQAWLCEGFAEAADGQGG